LPSTGADNHPSLEASDTDATIRAVTDGDHVDHLIEQWRRERPDLDVSPMAVIARIQRLSRILERRIEDRFSEYGLNRAQFGVLAALRRAGPPYCLSPTALYGEQLISSGAMTNRMERLTSAGYVRRVRDQDDGRSMLVTLTPKGKRLIDKVLAVHYDNERHLLAVLSPRERESLARILRRLLIEFEDNQPPEASRPAAAGDGRISGRSSRRRPAGSAPSDKRLKETPKT
jgi:DNA-binding MarR family transcriptional regulator